MQKSADFFFSILFFFFFGIALHRGNIFPANRKHSFPLTLKEITKKSDCVSLNKLNCWGKETNHLSLLLGKKEEMRKSPASITVQKLPRITMCFWHQLLFFRNNHPPTERRHFTGCTRILGGRKEKKRKQK